MTESPHILLDAGDKLGFTVNTFIGTRGAVLGAPGGGKSTFMARAVEQLCPYLPTIIYDPHSTYWGLNQKFDFLIVGRSAHSHFEIKPEQAKQLADLIYDERRSIILDMLDYDDEEADRLLTAFFDAIWRAALNEKRPIEIVLEEAHNLIPENAKSTPARRLMHKMAKEGRQFGVGFLLATQAASAISKEVLRACELRVLFGINDNSDLEIYKNMLPGNKADITAQVYALEPGDAIVKLHKQVQQVHFLNQETYHAGATPTLEAADVPKLRPISSAFLDALQAALFAPDAADVPQREALGSDAVLMGRIRALEAQIADMAHEQAARESELLESIRLQCVADLEQVIERWRTADLTVDRVEPTYTDMIQRATDEISRAVGIPSEYFAPTRSSRQFNQAVAPFDPRNQVILPELEPTGIVLTKPLSKTQKTILFALYDYPLGNLWRAQVAVLSGYSVKSSSFDEALRRLRDSGLIAIAAVGGGITLTSKGSERVYASLERPPEQPNAERLRSLWIHKLPPAMANVFKALLESPNAQVSKETVADATGYSLRSSSFEAAFLRLRRLGLINQFGDRYSASSEFFERG